EELRRGVEQHVALRVRRRRDGQVRARADSALEDVRGQIHALDDVVHVAVQRDLRGAVAAGEPRREVEARVRGVYDAGLHGLAANDQVAGGDARAGLRRVDRLGPFRIFD